MTRRRLAQRLLLAGLTVLALVVARGNWPSPPLTGHAQVVDGDTLRLARQRVRLAGLDAPELEQDCTDAAGVPWQCGRAARDFLVHFVAGTELTCTPAGRDAYRRTLAHCTSAGVDIGTALVTAGWALSLHDYPDAEAAARAAHAGIWQGSFDTPADWRRSHAGEPAWWDWLRSWFT